MTKHNYVKERHNISLTLYDTKKGHTVKAYDFKKGAVIFKRDFKDAQQAYYMYHDIVMEDIQPDGSGLRGRWDGLTKELHEGL